MYFFFRMNPDVVKKFNDFVRGVQQARINLHCEALEKREEEFKRRMPNYLKCGYFGGPGDKGGTAFDTLKVFPCKCAKCVRDTPFIPFRF